MTTLTTYEATAAREGKFWVVTVNGLPDGEQNVTQGLTWTEAQANARELVSLVLDIDNDPDAYTVDLVPADPDMFEVLKQVEAADAEAKKADELRRAALEHAARTLVDRGLTQAEAGRMLGRTHQRIAQLAPKRKNPATTVTKSAKKNTTITKKRSKVSA